MNQALSFKVLPKYCAQANYADRLPLRSLQYGKLPGSRLANGFTWRAIVEEPTTIAMVTK